MIFTFASSLSAEAAYDLLRVKVCLVIDIVATYIVVVVLFNSFII